MYNRPLRALTALLYLSVLSSCTAIDLQKIEPAITPTAAACSSTLNSMPSGNTFSFLLPRSVAGDPQFSTNSENHTVGFSQFARAATVAQNSLPTDLANDEVAQTLLRLMIKVSATAQVQAAADRGMTVSAEQTTAITNYDVPTSLSSRQLRDFAEKLIDHGLRATPNSGSGMVTSSTPNSIGSTSNALGTYFIAYYNGDYVDRFGQAISKPQLSTTLPDTEIAAALSVLLDYLVDSVDPTPVLGDAPSADTIGTSTKFYPAGTTSKPTILATNLANYKQLPASGCGLNTKNISLLLDVANAAGDRAAGLSGLTTQSFGGIEIGLGVLGKLSLGDNQLLATMVKTAASRLAVRSTYAASYWAFASLPDGVSGNTASSLAFR